MKATATLEKCDICGAKKKNIEQHKRLAHPVEEPKGFPGGGSVGDEKSPHPTIQEIADLKEQIAGLQKVNKTVEDIARILYDDIVKPLCQEKGISLGEWDNTDQNDYLKVARRIKG